MRICFIFFSFLCDSKKSVKINSGPFCFPRDECGEFPLPSDRWHHGGEQEPDQWECEHREAEPGGPGRQRESSQDWGQGPPAKGLPIC